MTVAGYGRYKDDPNHVGCPRAKTNMTPCVARDGSTACTDDGQCVGCRHHPADLLTGLVREVTANATVLTAEDLELARNALAAVAADPREPQRYREWYTEVAEKLDRIKSASDAAVRDR